MDLKFQLISDKSSWCMRNSKPSEIQFLDLKCWSLSKLYAKAYVPVRGEKIIDKYCVFLSDSWQKHCREKTCWCLLAGDKKYIVENNFRAYWPNIQSHITWFQVVFWCAGDGAKQFHQVHFLHLLLKLTSRNSIRKFIACSTWKYGSGINGWKATYSSWKTQLNCFELRMISYCSFGK